MNLVSSPATSSASSGTPGTPLLARYRFGDPGTPVEKVNKQRISVIKHTAYITTAFA